MKRAFELFEQSADVVEAEPRPQTAQVARRDSERRARRFSRGTRQAAAQRVVDELTKRPPGPACQRLQFRPHILIKRDRRPHALMLLDRHHDVNCDAQRCEEDIGRDGACVRSP